VKISKKCARGIAFLALLLVMTGCGGFHAQKSFSILDVLLPGVGSLIKADPVPVQPDLNHPNPSAISVTQTA